MFRRIRSRMTYANVASSLALLFALSTGGAYAANTIGSSDIIDESIQSQDVKNGQVHNADLGPNGVTSGKIADGTIAAGDLGTASVSGTKLHDDSVTTAKVRDDTAAGGGLTAPDLATGSVASDEVANETLTSSDLATDSVQATEVADNSIDAGEIVDFGLTNQDIGVLYAQVNADGTIANSSGGLSPGTGVTGTRTSTGVYTVDFGFNISNCAYTMTEGEAGVGGAGGGITGVTDKAGNANAVFATMRDANSALVDRGFQLVVVC